LIPKSYEPLVNTLIYYTKLPNFNELVKILFHDEVKEKIHGMKIEHEVLFTKSKHKGSEKRSQKGVGGKHEGS
jgi:hypothetical protein